MADAVVIQMLKQKRAEISGAIAVYEAQIAQARHDLAHINASIRLFEGGETERSTSSVMASSRKARLWIFACAISKADGELNTRQLAERVMCERNLDATDAALRNSVVFKVVQALRHAARRKVGDHGREAQGDLYLDCCRRSQPAPCQYPFQALPDEPISDPPENCFPSDDPKPTGRGGVSAEIFCRHAVVLTADHPPKAGEIAFAPCSCGRRRGCRRPNG